MRRDDAAEGSGTVPGRTGHPALLERPDRGGSFWYVENYCAIALRRRRGADHVGGPGAEGTSRIHRCNTSRTSWAAGAWRGDDVICHAGSSTCTGGVWGECTASNRHLD